jgi:hypothetical protein
MQNERIHQIIEYLQSFLITFRSRPTPATDDQLIDLDEAPDSQPEPPPSYHHMHAKQTEVTAPPKKCLFTAWKPSKRV